LKTKAGKCRIIPIHHELLPTFKHYYLLNKDNEFLFTIDDKKIDYNTQFRWMYNEFMGKLEMDHKTHDGRKTLYSELDRIGISKTIRDKIFGHKSGDIDNIYAKKSFEELKEAIEMVDYRSKKNAKITYLKVSS